MKKNNRAKPGEGANPIHINPSGRVVFNQKAAERMRGPDHMAVTIVIRLVPTNKASHTTRPVKKDGANRPFISATQYLRRLGFELPKGPYDPDVVWYGDSGFELHFPPRSAKSPS